MSGEKPVEERLLSFLREVITKERPGLIVCGERKATAVMRALIQELPSNRLDWDWRKVLSTAAMASYDWSRFEGGSVVLFEELVHHGESMRRKLEEMSPQVGLGVVIKTAGFGVWDRCEHLPDYYYHGALDSAQYSSLRDEIVAMLQAFGSLLLDTEHVELNVRIDCSVRELYDQLARGCEAGNAFSFLSSSKRLNLTMFEPDILYQERMQRALTPGSNTTSVVRKCRVIEKSHGQFAVMPIFYPNVRCVVDEDWVASLPSFVDKRRMAVADPKELFYIVGLLSSIELLPAVIAALTDLLRAGKVILEAPSETLAHLCTMFPSIRMDELFKYIDNVVAESRQLRPQRSTRTVEVQHLAQGDLMRMSYSILDRLRRRVDESPVVQGAPRGCSWRQMSRLACGDGAEVAGPAAGWAAAPDRLIDSGLLVTNVEEVLGAKSETWALRTFSPDSELVSDKLRRHALVVGEKWLPQI